MKLYLVEEQCGFICRSLQADAGACRNRVHSTHGNKNGKVIHYGLFYGH